MNRLSKNITAGFILYNNILLLGVIIFCSDNYNNMFRSNTFFYW